MAKSLLPSVTYITLLRTAGRLFSVSKNSALKWSLQYWDSSPEFRSKNASLVQLGKRQRGPEKLGSGLAEATRALRGGGMGGVLTADTGRGVGRRAGGGVGWYAVCDGPASEALSFPCFAGGWPQSSHLTPPEARE